MMACRSALCGLLVHMLYRHRRIYSLEDLWSRRVHESQREQGDDDVETEKNEFEAD